MKSHLKAKCIGLLMLLLVGISGCGKKQPPASAPMDVGGVKVDMPKLNQEFATATPEIQATVHEASSDLRYGQYEKALQSLDKLMSNPALSDSQKKVVTDVIEQMKQVIAKAGPARQ